MSGLSHHAQKFLRQGAGRSSAAGPCAMRPRQPSHPPPQYAASSGPASVPRPSSRASLAKDRGKQAGYEDEPEAYLYEDVPGWKGAGYAKGTWSKGGTASPKGGGCTWSKGSASASSAGVWDDSEVYDDAAEDFADDSPGVHYGVLKMFNEAKGFGFISPVQSELPQEFASSASGVWFFAAPHLPSKDEALGQQVRFNLELSSSNKPQAIDVTLADGDCSTNLASDLPAGDDDDFTSRIVLVSRMPSSLTVQDIEYHFSKFGSVDTVSMLPGRQNPSCCIVYSTREDAESTGSKGQMPMPGSGSVYVQSFSHLSEDLQATIQHVLDDQLPASPVRRARPTQSDPRHIKPAPVSNAVQGRLIGTVSNAVPADGMRAISCSKLVGGVATFDIHLAPDDALEGATVAFYVDSVNDGHAYAYDLEVLSRPSPENASRLGAAATAAHCKEMPDDSRKRAKGVDTKDAYLKCFPCRAAMNGQCADEARCPNAHTLAEIRPMPDTKAVRRVARKLFGKAALLPMAAPTPQPMAFGMMPPAMAPVWGMNPFGMPGMPVGGPSFFQTAPSRKKRKG